MADIVGLYLTRLYLLSNLDHPPMRGGFCHGDARFASNQQSKESHNTMERLPRNVTMYPISIYISVLDLGNTCQLYFYILVLDISYQQLGDICQGLTDF